MERTTIQEHTMCVVNKKQIATNWNRKNKKILTIRRFQYLKEKLLVSCE